MRWKHKLILVEEAVQSSVNLGCLVATWDRRNFLGLGQRRDSPGRATIGSRQLVLNGKPHSRPVWGVWLDDIFYFSTGSLAASNLIARPAISVHLESGSEVVIIEGVAEPVSDAVLVEQVVSMYNRKYNWNVDPHNLPGPFYAVRPQVAFGWDIDESELNPESTGLRTATRWHFK